MARLIALLLSITAVVAVMFVPVLTRPEMVVPFDKAAESGDVTITAHRGDSCLEAVVIVHNRGDLPVSLSMPSGLVLISPHARQPDMVLFQLCGELQEHDEQPVAPLLTGDQLGELRLEPGDRRLLLVQVLSLEFWRVEHEPGALLLAAEMDPLLNHLLVTISRLAKDAPTDLVQTAVWALTNNVSREEVKAVYPLTERDLFTVRYWLVSAGLDGDRMQLTADLVEQVCMMGQPANAGDVEVRMWSVAREQEIGGVHAPAGREYVLVSLGLKNHGQQLVVMTEANFTLIDYDGREYRPSLLSGKLVDGFRWRMELEPERPVTGVLVFEVSARTRGVMVRYDDGDRYFECWGL